MVSTQAWEKKKYKQQTTRKSLQNNLESCFPVSEWPLDIAFLAHVCMEGRGWHWTVFWVTFGQAWNPSSYQRFELQGAKGHIVGSCGLGGAFWCCRHLWFCFLGTAQLFQGWALPSSLQGTPQALKQHQALGKHGLFHALHSVCANILSWSLVLLMP